MTGEVEIGNKKYAVDFSKGESIAIALNFNAEQPNTYGVKKASSKAYQDEAFIGDRRKGGPCNFETYSLTPHCNGTHTECIGHITNERISILSSLKDELIPGTLITVIPQSTKEKYQPALNTEDLVITKEVLEKQLKDYKPNFLKGLIIRTTPNSESKKSRDYMQMTPSFLSIDAMEYIVSLGVTHLLVDTPSVDKLYDDGHLSSHNIFWETTNKIFNKEAQEKTITEMIFVDDKIKDGVYLINLQIAAFASDASPSRPILYKIHEV